MNKKNVFTLLCAFALLAASAGVADDSHSSKAKKTTKTNAVSTEKTKSAGLPLGRPHLFPMPAPKQAAADDRLGTAVPKADLFLGYNYLRLNPGHGVPGINANGGGANIGFNVNRYFGIVADFAGTAYSQDIGGTKFHGNTLSYLFGPRVSWRNWPRAVPFLQTLFGGMRNHVSGTSENAFAWTAGGGVDLIAAPHIGIRLLQAEYALSRFKGPGGGRETQNNFRLGSGIVFRLGLPAPPPPPNHPPVASCSAAKSSVYEGSGDVVSVRASASDPDNDPLTYAWSASGGSVDGTGPEVRWNSAGLAVGSYKVSARVSDGKGGTASCDADIRVEPKPNRAPVMSCSVERSPVLVGERVRVSATASDPDNDPLTYSWRTSGGQIIGSGASVQLDTTGLTPGRYTITGRVEDGRGGAADCSASVDVKLPPPPPQASKINECLFRAGSARVDNVCKRILDDVVIRLNNEPSASIGLVGFADPKEARAAKLSADRSKQAAKYLTGKGVAASRIQEKTGTGQKGAGKQNRRVDVIFVPAGATF